jgi:two-component system response regulator MprA
VVVAKVGGDERHLLEATLEQSGFTVVPAGDGVEALEMVCAVGPDAIIADLDGRDLDGVVLCRVLRGLRAHARLPVLVLTSARGSTDRARTLRGLGGVWVIRKPVGSAEIAGALSQMLSMVGAPATPSPARRTASP